MAPGAPAVAPGAPVRPHEYRRYYSQEFGGSGDRRETQERMDAAEILSDAGGWPREMASFPQASRPKWLDSPWGSDNEPQGDPEGNIDYSSNYDKGNNELSTEYDKGNTDYFTNNEENNVRQLDKEYPRRVQKVRKKSPTHQRKKIKRLRQTKSSLNFFTRLLNMFTKGKKPAQKRRKHYEHHITLSTPRPSNKKRSKMKRPPKKKRLTTKKPRRAYIGQPDRFDNADWPSMTGIMHSLLSFLSQPADYNENFGSYFAGGGVKKPQNYGGGHGGNYGGDVGGGGGGGGGYHGSSGGAPTSGLNFREAVENFVGYSSLSRKVDILVT